jgi:hypothetical protein
MRRREWTVESLYFSQQCVPRSVSSEYCTACWSLRIPRKGPWMRTSPTVSQQRAAVSEGEGATAQSGRPKGAALRYPECHAAGA